MDSVCAVDRAAPAPVPIYVMHWNAPDWLRSTVSSFLQLSTPTQVTVVDNGPYEPPLALDARVSVIRSGANIGYAGGANIGIKDWLARGGEFCIVACHDVALEAHALEQLLAAASVGVEYGVLAPEPAESVAAGPVISQSENVSEVAWASGTCLLLRRECIELVGLFDESFGSYGEDIDLCYRVRAAGWKVGVVSGVKARGRGSVNPGFRTQMYVNQIRLRLKHAGTARALRMLVAFPMLALRDTVRSLFVGDRALRPRARARVRAVPSGAALIWRRLRAGH
jgi:N-acetylglucosaminyl-diphospho-decaprenol L-rhamnosyltransferase